MTERRVRGSAGWVLGAEVRSASEIEDDVEPAELTKREVNEFGALHRIVEQAGLQRHHRASRAVNERGCPFGGLDADIAANDCGTRMPSMPSLREFAP